MLDTVPTDPPEREPDLNRFADYLAAARKLRIVNRDALGAVLTGIQLDAGERHVVNLLAEMPTDTVASVLQLLKRCRTGAGAFTAPLWLPAASVEDAYVNGDRAPGWQARDASDETTWHDVTSIVECEDTSCLIADEEFGVTCVVIVSGAYQAGHAHLRSIEPVPVRIPAGAW